MLSCIYTQDLVSVCRAPSEHTRECRILAMKLGRLVTFGRHCFTGCTQSGAPGPSASCTADGQRACAFLQYRNHPKTVAK